MSLHRYDNAGFYPASEEADYTYCGKGKGEGYNVNIAWNYVRKYALTVVWMIALCVHIGEDG